MADKAEVCMCEKCWNEAISCQWIGLKRRRFSLSNFEEEMK
jgi:hypothetical protein